MIGVKWFSAVFLFFVCSSFTGVSSWGSSNTKVKLSDVQTLTLYHGQMTTGQRSKPVPQVQCVGGTAGCATFVPQVVQCSNKGSDGFDIQWECKTDMDNAYRFGRIDVICEGYEYPDDPYILKGSCGLEYTLDLSAEGIKKKGSHDYYGSGSSFFGGGSNYQSPKPAKSTGMGDGIMLVIIMLLIYGLYRTCVRNTQRSPTGDDSYPPGGQPGSGFGYPSSAPPPPPGFRPGYTPDAGCGATNMGSTGSSGAGGFWGGAMTGGLLGYMFGNRNRGYQQMYREPSNSNQSWGGFGGSGSSFGSSSGTRTASGFGGTRRR